MKKRVKLTVAYDGTNYHGWQLQENSVTIEGELNKALSELTGENITVIGASRTDAGVHSNGTVAVFDTDSNIPGDRFVYAINTKLPNDIKVIKSCEVDGNFHPRHCASIKTYQYKVYCADTEIPTKNRYSYYLGNYNLNLSTMQEAGEILIGKHDFKSFCSVHTQAETTIREITEIKILSQAIGGFDNAIEIVIQVSGYGFLYNMVRIIAGTLVEVGKGRIEPIQVKEILENCDRTIAGPTLPANGLTLHSYKYIE